MGKNKSKEHFENSWLIEHGMLREVVSYLQSVLVKAYDGDNWEEGKKLIFEAIGVTEPEQLPPGHGVHRILRLLAEGKEPRLTGEMAPPCLSPERFDEEFGGPRN